MANYFIDAPDHYDISGEDIIIEHCMSWTSYAHTEHSILRGPGCSSACEGTYKWLNRPWEYRTYDESDMHACNYMIDYTINDWRASFMGAHEYKRMTAKRKEEFSRSFLDTSGAFDSVAPWHVGYYTALKIACVFNLPEGDYQIDGGIRSDLHDALASGVEKIYPLDSVDGIPQIKSLRFGVEPKSGKPILVDLSIRNLTYED